MAKVWRKKIKRRFVNVQPISYVRDMVEFKAIDHYDIMIS
jgi:hypothetical protein